MVFVAVPLVLSAVAFLAVWLPARRASRIDPIIALARRVKILHAERRSAGTLCPDVVCTRSERPPHEPSRVARRSRHDRRIGLALGGGSARGIAHIGVLEWFEEHHIPIDYIVGTSMGGLIAGAYASGMTPAEIRELMKDCRLGPDVPVGLAIPLQDVPPQDRTSGSFPRSSSSGSSMACRCPARSIPASRWRCCSIASRCRTAISSPSTTCRRPFVRSRPTCARAMSSCSDGRLSSRAMRATMSIPGVFAPVNWDEWLLVDGGVLNNVPANVARSSAPTSSSPSTSEPMSATRRQQTASLLSLLGKTIDTMMTTSTRRSLEVGGLSSSTPT